MATLRAPSDPRPAALATGKRGLPSLRLTESFGDALGPAGTQPRSTLDQPRVSTAGWARSRHLGAHVASRWRNRRHRRLESRGRPYMFKSSRVGAAPPPAPGRDVQRRRSPRHRSGADRFERFHGSSAAPIMTNVESGADLERLQPAEARPVGLDRGQTNRGREGPSNRPARKARAVDSGPAAAAAPDPLTGRTPRASRREMPRPSPGRDVVAARRYTFRQPGVRCMDHRHGGRRGARSPTYGPHVGGPRRERLMPNRRNGFRRAGWTSRTPRPSGPERLRGRCGQRRSHGQPHQGQLGRHLGRAGGLDGGLPFRLVEDRLHQTGCPRRRRAARADASRSPTKLVTEINVIARGSWDRPTPGRRQGQGVTLGRAQRPGGPQTGAVRGAAIRTRRSRRPARLSSVRTNASASSRPARTGRGR